MRTFYIAIYASILFGISFAIAQATIPAYIEATCRHFDYNDHAKWTWNWWVEQCSAML